MDTADLGRLGLLGLFVVLSAFFSGSETALVALSRARLTHLVNIGQPGASRVAQLVHRPEKFLAMVLLSNNLVNTAVAVIGTSLVVNMMGNNSTAVVVSTLGVTLVLLIFGETLPKTIAWREPEKVAFAVITTVVLCGVAAVSVCAPAAGSQLVGQSSAGHQQAPRRR